MKIGDPRGVLVIGYGTLLHQPSLTRTIGGTDVVDREMTPVVVRGFRRLFNLRPDHYDWSNLLGRPGVEQGAMNVEGAEAESLNGLAFRVSPEDLEKLDRRENAYERVQVEMYDFDTGTLIEPGHIYSSTPDARWIERDPSKLLPLWRDVVWARTGAYRISRRFGAAFDRTTYLADGETLVVDRYQEHLSRGAT